MAFVFEERQIPENSSIGAHGAPVSRRVDAASRAQQRAAVMRRFEELRALPKDDPRHGQLRAALIEEHLRYARHIALRYGGRGQLAEDFVQVAYLALVRAVDNFDPARGTEFLGYATPVILGEIKKYFRDATWDVHVPRGMQELSHTVRSAGEQLTRERGRSPTVEEIAQRIGVEAELVTEALVAAGVYRIASLDRPLGSGEDAGASLGDIIGADDPRLQTVVDRAALKPLISALDERDRQILMLRFFQGLSQREIAARMGYSQMHISRLLTSICSRLRAALG